MKSSLILIRWQDSSEIILEFSDKILSHMKHFKRIIRYNISLIQYNIFEFILFEQNILTKENKIILIKEK